jgi:hypothetical protein
LAFGITSMGVREGKVEDKIIISSGDEVKTYNCILKELLIYDCIFSFLQKQ